MGMWVTKRQWRETQDRIAELERNQEILHDWFTVWTDKYGHHSVEWYIQMMCDDKTQS